MRHSPLPWEAKDLRIGDYSYSIIDALGDPVKFNWDDAAEENFKLAVGCMNNSSFEIPNDPLPWTLKQKDGILFYVNATGYAVLMRTQAESALRDGMIVEAVNKLGGQNELRRAKEPPAS